MNAPYHIEKNNQRMIVRLNIENLDGGVCTRLLGELSAQISSTCQLVLDTQQVQFADSSGLGLIRTLERMVPAKKLVLRNVGHRLFRCLQRIPEDKIPSIEFGEISKTDKEDATSKPMNHSPVDHDDSGKNQKTICRNESSQEEAELTK